MAASTPVFMEQGHRFAIGFRIAFTFPVSSKDVHLRGRAAFLGS